MEPIPAQAADLIQILSQNLPLTIVGLLLITLIGAAFYSIATTPTRVNKRVVELTQNIETIMRQLNEAEKIGHFGSFTWDFNNPSASVWSGEMFHLCGLVPRNTTPSTKALLEHVYGRDREAAQAAWTKAQTVPGPFEFTFTSVSPTGERRSVHIKGTTLLGPDRRPQLIRGVAHDITKENEIDRSKSEFVSLASHQLKTPLTTLRWYAEALERGSVGELTSEQKKYVSQIYDVSGRMMNMVNDFLSVSRMEMGTLVMKSEDIDMLALTQSVINEQAATAQSKRLTLRLTGAPDVPHIRADGNLVRMIMQNLVSNAIKYTPEDGSVECAITTGGASRESVYVRISDTGIGIPKSEQGRVFERLHRASNAEALVSEGTGLGLYLVKMIIDRVGGSIDFSSTEGKGTTFSLSLPKVWTDRSHSASAPRPGGRATISA